MKITPIIFGISAVLLISAAIPAADASPSETDPGYLSLERIIDSDEFDSKSFGPIRWLKDGSGYTTLEDSQDHEDVNDPNAEKSRDIVRYEPESGEREIMVPSTRLIPKDESNPLKIDDYSWSSDGKKLLIFTNTKRVWRRNTRGDFWVLDLTNWELQKLGGEVKPSTLMFAKFSPDGQRVAYVREKNIYVQNLKDLRITQLTNDGSENIINGTSDWVMKRNSGCEMVFAGAPTVNSSPIGNSTPKACVTFI